MSPNRTKFQTLSVLGLIWLVFNLIDRLWLTLDTFPPAWDQSNHLTNSLRFLDALQHPQFFDGDWWRNFWMISTKYPPVTYITSVPFQMVFGTGNDNALLSNLFYSGLLIVCVYAIATTLFNSQVGIIASVMSLLFPRVIETRLLYLLDTPLMTLTIACFAALTLWKDQKARKSQWLWSIIFGIAWGFALLTKQSVMFFLIIPLLWVGIGKLWQRKWERIGQLLVSFLVSALIWFPWYRTNWIYLFSTAQNSVSIPAAAEGDPSLKSLAAWTYYWQDLPFAVSWVLLIVPIVGLILHLFGKFSQKSLEIDNRKAIRSLKWLGVYVIGGYLICSANVNKDTRYILPYLPILAIILAYFLTLWRGKWGKVRWITLAVAFGVILAKLFPIPVISPLANHLSPGIPNYPQNGANIPNRAMVQTIIETNPYQSATVGVIPNVFQVNHNTFNYYGALANFQVAGRELGSKPEEVSQDAQNFPWFVTKEGGETGFAKEPQLKLGEKLANDPDFTLVNTWQLPDLSLIKLYHRKNPPISVKLLPQTPDKVTLDKITVPDTFPAGHPVPITYQWSGSRKALKSGIVLLSWKSVDNPENLGWIHDHALGMGEIATSVPDEQGFEITEKMAMLPDATLPAGQYTLSATYLNRKTAEAYPIDISPVIVTIDPTATPLPAPPVDYVTQLRQLALNLPKGVAGLDPIFQQVDRLNQYDARQDYLKQAEISLNYRLQQNPEKIDWWYGLALANVLQEDAPDAIATLTQLTQRDAQNPFSHAYLAFVYLYNWQPKAAERALQPALALNNKIPEINALEGISAVMQGDFIKGWRILSEVL